MESNAKTGLRNHGEIVGTITNGNGLGQVHLLYLRNELEQLCFTMTIDDFSDITSCQFSIVIDFQLVGIYIVNAIATLEIFSEIGESTTQNGNLITAGL